MGLLSRSTAFLNRALESDRVSVTYTRGGQTISITAEVGRTAFSQTSPNPGGASLIWGDRDYLVDVADLSPFGGKPEEGDQLRETVNGLAKVYEVMRPATGEPAFRFSDTAETKWRLHVKQV